MTSVRAPHLGRALQSRSITDFLNQALRFYLLGRFSPHLLLPGQATPVHRQQLRMVLSWGIGAEPRGRGASASAQRARRNGSRQPGGPRDGRPVFTGVNNASAPCIALRASVGG